MKTGLNRRRFIQTGALAGAGALVVSQTACGPKVSFYVATIKGALIELKPLLPGAAQLISTAVKVADDFDAAYRRGDFADAITILKTLAGNIGQIADDAGVSTPQIKGIIAVAAIALRTIALLLDEQSTQPAVAAARKKATKPQAAAAAEVHHLSNPGVIDAIFMAAKP